MNNFSISQATANKIRFAAGVVAAAGFIIAKVTNAEEMMITTSLPGMDFMGSAQVAGVNYTGNYVDANWVHPESWTATVNGTGEFITWENITQAMAALNITDIELCYLRRNSNFTTERNFTTPDQSPLLHEIVKTDRPLANRMYCYMQQLCKGQAAKLAKYLCDWKREQNGSVKKITM